MTADSPLGLAVLFSIGAVASAVNTVAGGGSLLSFPTLIFGFGVPSKEANATNALGLWPGSLGGALGFRNLYDQCKRHMRLLILPTLIGSIAGAWLLVSTDKKVFDFVVPILLLLAATLLLIQPKIKKFANDHLGKPTISNATAWILQLLVAIYGGYFGAGMGIMMLAAFSLFMDGTIHEINAVKNWLGLIINAVASAFFVYKGLVLFIPGAVIAIGAILGGFLAGKYSQRVDPEKLRIIIAIYGVGMAVFYAIRTYGG